MDRLLIQDDNTPPAPHPTDTLIKALPVTFPPATSPNCVEPTAKRFRFASEQQLSELAATVGETIGVCGIARVEMEVLRTQVDGLRWENNQLEADVLRDKNPEVAISN